MPDSFKTPTVPYIVYESAEARAERRHRHLVRALIIAVVLLFASNALWLWAWMQYDYTSEEITVESTDLGNANYIGANARGMIFNGED